MDVETGWLADCLAIPGITAAARFLRRFLSPPSRLCCAFLGPSELALITISSNDSVSLLLTSDLTVPDFKVALSKQSNGTV